MCLYAGIRSFIKSLLHFSLLSAAALLNFLIFPLPCKYNIYAPWSLSSPSQNLSFPVFSAASPDIPGWPQSQQLQTHQFPFVKPFYPLLFPRSYRASFPPHHCAALCHAAGEQGLPWDSVLGLIPSLTLFSLNPASPMKTIKPLPPFCLSYFCNLTSSMKKATIKYLIPQATICSLFSVRDCASPSQMLVVQLLALHPYLAHCCPWPAPSQHKHQTALHYQQFASGTLLTVLIPCFALILPGD